MTESLGKEKRIDSIDILRAVGIIIMVMGHVGFGGKFDRYIHTFHMPLFFLISGFLFKHKTDVSIGKLIGAKAKRLLLPYVTYACINYLFWLILVKGAGDLWWMPLVRLLTYNTENLPICGALWFLTSMFFAEAIYLILDRLFKKDLVRSVVVFFIAIGFSLFESLTGFRLPLSIDTSLVCMGFLEVGRLYKEYKEGKPEKEEKNIIILAGGILFLIVNAVLAFVNDYVNIKSGWYGIVPVFWINAVIGTVAFALLVKWFTRVTKDSNRIRGLLAFIGRNSMIFLGLNQLVILIFSILYEKCNLPGNIYIRGIVILTFSIAVLWGICALVNKAKCKALKLWLGI